MSSPESAGLSSLTQPAVSVLTRYRVGNRRARRRWFLRPAPLISWTVLLVFVVAAIFAPEVSPKDPTASIYVPLSGLGSPGHLLGTDTLGRDELSRVIWGARPILIVSLLSVLLALVVGTSIGLVAGYFGGGIESVLMRAMDITLSFPVILLAIMLVAALGPSRTNLAVAIGVALIPAFARLARTLSARVASMEYVLAAKVAGFGVGRILFREILPNLFGPILIQAASMLGLAAGYASALSYLGLGIQPPTPDWGYMVAEGQQLIFIAPRLAIIPAVLITMFVLACNFIADELRDMFDIESGN